MSAATPRGRWAVYGLLLAAAAALAWFGDKTPAGAAAPALAAASGAARPVPARKPSAARAPEPLEALLPRDAGASAALPPRADLFATPAWRRPPPPPPAAKAASAPPAPPPAPQAPAVPYRVIGKQHDGERWALFLARDDTPFVVRDGDLLEASWRVLSIEPPRATLQHLPTGQERSLDIGPSP